MNRLLLPKLIALLVLVALIGRLYQLQVQPDEAERYRDSSRARTSRFLPVRPMRGEIFAADGKTLLAESVPIYTVAIRPADLPSLISEPEARAEVFSRLSQLLGISNTLTISPAAARTLLHVSRDTRTHVIEKRPATLHEGQFTFQFFTRYGLLIDA